MRVPTPFSEPLDTYLVGGLIEDRSHLAHVVDIESRVEHLALTSVLIACNQSG